MVPIDTDRPAGTELSPDHAGSTAVGKRFADEATGLEVRRQAHGQPRSQVGMSSSELEGTTQEQAVEIWTDWLSNGGGT